MKQDELGAHAQTNVPKLTAKTYDAFIWAFANKAERIKVANGTTLDYLLRTTPVGYNDSPVWTS